MVDSDEDFDRDRVDIATEIDARTNPRDADSDDDGRRDGTEDADRDGLRNAGEDATGNDPRDPDTDDDGTRDGGERAGAVASFADGVLTIRLATGSELSGAVTDETEIECKTEDEHEDGDESRDEDDDASAASHPDDDERAEDDSDSELEWGRLRAGATPVAVEPVRLRRRCGRSRAAA